MASLSRFGVSLDKHLLHAFDGWLRRKGFANRSQAIAEQIRGSLVKEEWEAGTGTVIGAVTLVYDPAHHVLGHTLTKAQHGHHDRILSSQHIHLDARNCLEVVVLRGPAKEVKELAEQLRSLKGIKHGQWIMSTTGGSLP